MSLFGACAATKAAVTSFAEMLSAEVAGQGVTVTAPCPGVVRTEFSAVGEMQDTERNMPGAIVIEADECAKAALEGLENGRRILSPKLGVKALTCAGSHLPRALWLPICQRMMAP